VGKKIKIIFPKGRNLNGHLTIPGSKSISNRFLILNYLAGNATLPLNLSDAEDTLLLKKNLEIIEQNRGIGSELYCHHGGAPFRFLMSLLSIIPGEWTLDGSERLRERPHGELLNALRRIGAEISGNDGTDFPPFKIKGNPLLSGGEIKLNASVSSQIISSLLIIAPLLKNGLVIHTEGNKVSESYIDMTIKMMKEFGVEVEKVGKTFRVEEGKYFFNKKNYRIESDWPSASYIYEWLAFSDMGHVELEYFINNSIQPDSITSEIFKAFGVKSVFKSEGKLIISKNENASLPTYFEFDFTRCPDIAQTVALTCFVLKIPFHLKGLDTLNKKECERLNILGALFREINGECVFDDHSMSIKKYSYNQFIPDIIGTYHDHRMAMALSGLAVLKNGLIMDDANVVKKSYPNFWQDLHRLGIEIQAI
jgi:3-phosphoshikimate 1-carboxyvinyltransferase